MIIFKSVSSSLLFLCVFVFKRAMGGDVEVNDISKHYHSVGDLKEPQRKLRSRELQRRCNFRCPINSSRKPNRQCYDNFDDCQCDSGFSRTRNGCTGGTNTRYCSENKKIKVSQICINGDFDGFEFGDRFGSGGEEAEVRIRLDGIIHYPTSGSSCRQKPRGFCKLEDGQCHKIDDAPFQSIEGHRSITVGVEEFDKNSRNEKLIAVMRAKDWYADTCDKYEIILSRDFKSEKERSVCMDFGISGKVRTPDFRGEIGLSAGVQSCTRWVDPAESFIWYMEVVPSD